MPDLAKIIEAAIKDALRSVLHLRSEDLDHVQYWRSDKAWLEVTPLDHVVAHLADAVRAAGQIRTEYRQFDNGIPLNVSASGGVAYGLDVLRVRHERGTRHGRVMTTESREVLTLTGEWEPVEVPATAAENGEQ